MNTYQIYAALFIAGVLTSALVQIFGFYSGQSKSVREIASKIKAAESKSNEIHGNSNLSWDIARLTMEKYFTQNIEQTSQIYKLSLISIIFGFGIIIFGSILSYTSESPNSTPAVIAAIGGLTSQFIGATFLFIYKSALDRANQQMELLERINSVGMAVQILNTIEDSAANDNLRSLTISKITEAFVSGSYSIHKKDNA